MGELCVLVHNGSCPNPNGRKGGKAHQDLIQKTTNEYKSMGYEVKTEHGMRITNGYKSKRYVDIMADNGIEKIYIQVGKQLKNGQPVIRERKAIIDLLSAGADVIFKAYNG